MSVYIKEDLNADFMEMACVCVVEDVLFSGYAPCSISVLGLREFFKGNTPPPIFCSGRPPVAGARVANGQTCKLIK
jgi:hypothetical protein